MISLVFFDIAKLGENLENGSLHLFQCCKVEIFQYSNLAI